ncbi:MAG TPA: tetratricopeptide repeat protein, partial [Longimicrobiales bacterium]|nr:tetratricopeptide repeat protein [Longimicrobiales bacterium]
MVTRGGLLIAIAVGFGITGCASGGTSTGGTATGGGAGDVTNLLTQGQRERETDNTRAAADALESAYDANDPAQAQQLFQQALQSAEAAIAEDTLNPLAYRLAGEANMGLENYMEAGEQLDRATELRPLYELELAGAREQAYIDLYMEASPLLDQGQYLEAAEVLEEANAIYPDRPEALITLAQIYAQERQHDRAIAAIDSAMAFLESDAMEGVDQETAAGWREQGQDLPLLRAQVLADAGRFEEAV